MAVANSFVFDWLLRKTLTTTVNYFILKSVPFPNINLLSPLATRIFQLAKKLSDDAPKHGEWRQAHLRSEIEALVARAYGITIEEMSSIVDDFPLLDRSEPAIGQESKSTVTRDLTLFTLAKGTKRNESLATLSGLERRIAEAKRVGALAFRPSHFVRADIRRGGALAAAKDNLN